MKNRSFILRSSIQFLFQYASTVNNPSQSVCHHIEQGSNGRKKKCRGNGKLDDMSNKPNIFYFTHVVPPILRDRIKHKGAQISIARDY